MLRILGYSLIFLIISLFCTMMYALFAINDYENKDNIKICKRADLLRGIIFGCSMGLVWVLIIQAVCSKIF